MLDISELPIPPGMPAGRSADSGGGVSVFSAPNSSDTSRVDSSAESSEETSSVDSSEASTVTSCDESTSISSERSSRSESDPLVWPLALNPKGGLLIMPIESSGKASRFSEAKSS